MCVVDVERFEEGVTRRDCSILRWGCRRFIILSVDALSSDLIGSVRERAFLSRSSVYV